MSFPLHRLAELRSAASMSQSSLARHLGVSIRTVQRWEAGDSRPFRRDMIALESLLSTVGAQRAPKAARKAR